MSALQTAKWMLLALSIAISIGLVRIGNDWPTIYNDCQNPTLTVGPEEDPSLQQLIDRATPRTIMHLKPSTYNVHLQITRSLTLCGDGPQQTILKGVVDQENPLLPIPVIKIFNATGAIEVTLEGLLVTKGQAGRDGGGIVSGGQARVTLKNVKVSAHESFGIGNDSKGQLTLQDVEISDNGSSGLFVAGEEPKVVLQRVLIAHNGAKSSLCDGLHGILTINPDTKVDKASYSLEDVKFVGNKCDGLHIEHIAQVTGQRLQMLDNGGGIWLEGAVVASLTDVEVGNNHVWGISLFEGVAGLKQGTQGIEVTYASPQLILQQAKIFNNQFNGLSVSNSAVAKLQGVTVEGNGTHPACKTNVRAVCNGVEVSKGAQVTIQDSTIRENMVWGVAAYLKKCGYSIDDFTGRVVLEGHNIIEGNNKAGKQQGEVCLP
ncbi:right-handed parallel beta-helix repeat-containing protein [Candidatus Acetothermia bacterium]|nr:right-handed parallel beta-helix repeat-containing protein [Candidatus Acetothermia bacterium]